jgi:hypothetical protein
MSVLSHFQSVASAAILSTDETTSIRTSIATLSTRLTSYFDKDISSQLRFGSSMRGTILPRKMDEHSDIDYMIVFADTTLKPQSYLDKLKRFADAHYKSSETKQSHPTIVLELNHIKFDLVPAISYWAGGYQIPDRNAAWQTTDPTSFSNQLEQANKNSGSLLKPAIRVVKYWNAKRGYPLESFGLEKWMASLLYWNCSNLRDCVLHAFDQFVASGYSTKWIREEIERAQSLATAIRDWEVKGYPVTAEQEASKLIPPVS